MKQRSEPITSKPAASAAAAPADRGAGWGWRGVVFILLVTGAVALTYQPVWRAGFVWDDAPHLLDNPVIRPGGLRVTWTPGGYLSYWPVTFTTYWLQFHAWGLHGTGFHLVNIALHVLACVLVWRVLARLGLAQPAAMLGAGLFALHPVNADSVAWISQLKGILALVFALAAVLYYLSYEERGRWWRYLLALVLFTASALSKGAVLTLPLVLLMCVWWRRGAITRRDLVRLLPWGLLAAGCVGMEIWTQRLVADYEVVRHADFPTRLAEAGYVVWFYLWKVVWPLNLCAVYPPYWTVNAGLVTCWLPDVGLVALVTLGWINRRGWGRPVLMALACYVLLLAPVLGLVDTYAMKFSLVADHYQYAAMVVPIAAVAALAASSAKRLRGKAGPWLVWVPAAGALVLLGCLTFAYCAVYHDELTLWRDVLNKNPGSWVAHNNFGLALAGGKRLDQAIDQYRQAIAIKPDYADAYVNLGNALRQAGQLDQAMIQYQKALAARPDCEPAHDCLGNALVACGRIDEAIVHLRRAVAINSGDGGAQVNLGMALAARGQVDEAIAQFQVALAADPDYAPAHCGLGVMLARLGRVDEAIAHYRKAVELQPDYAEAHDDLGVALGGQGRIDQAISQYRVALQIEPRFAQAHYHLGGALLGRGQVDEGIAQLKLALEIDPNYAEAHCNLGVALYGKGRISEAIEHLQQALALKPDFAEARRDLDAARAGRR